LNAELEMKKRMEKLLKNKFIFTPIILFILGFLPFLFNLHGFFVSDDWDFLTQVANSHQPLWRYFFTNYLGAHNGGSYRPLIVYFWSLSYQLWHLNFFWYHFLQIFFHASCVVLLYFVILNFFQPAKKEERFILAVAASAIFALLPNHSEAVAWIAAVVDPLCAFFYLSSLLALLLCLKFSKAKIYFYSISLIFFFAAIFTKEMAMSLPFIILIFTAYYFWKSRAKMINLLITVPYFIILAGFFLLRYHAIGLFFGYYGEEHLHLSLIKTISVYGNIIISFILSDNLRTIFSLWLDNNLFAAIIIIILFLAVLIYFTAKKKLPLWPWLVFLSLAVSIVPVMNFGIDLTRIYFSEDGERYGYLPSIFFSILFAAVLIYCWKKINSPARAMREAAKPGAIEARLFRGLRDDQAIFFAIIFLLACGLSVQLLLKNLRQAEAATLAQSSLQGAVKAMKSGNYQGVLFFGLPDDFHGAMIFRNGWQEAIDFYLPNPPIILSPFSRTVFAAKQKFLIEKVDDRTYNYSSTDNYKNILAKPQFSSADYSMVLDDYIYEPAGITNRYFGDHLNIKLSPSLAAQKNIALFFWEGRDWKVINQ
jgi:hypothetical protein